MYEEFFQKCLTQSECSSKMRLVTSDYCGTCSWSPQYCDFGEFACEYQVGPGNFQFSFYGRLLVSHISLQFLQWLLLKARSVGFTCILYEGSFSPLRVDKSAETIHVDRSQSVLIKRFSRRLHEFDWALSQNLYAETIKYIQNECTCCMMQNRAKAPVYRVICKVLLGDMLT